MNANITMTENAIKHISKMIAKNEAAIGFRLAVKKTGCSGYAYVTDIISQRNPEDACYEIDNIFLYVDAKSIQFLQGTAIDFIDHGLGQTKLVFNNPNAANLCGCGESFNLE